MDLLVDTCNPFSDWISWLYVVTICILLYIRALLRDPFDDHAAVKSTC